ERGDPTLVVVEITVVGVDGMLPTGDAVEGVRRAVVERVGVVEPVEPADGERGVKAAGEFSERELDGGERGGDQRGGGERKRTKSGGRETADSASIHAREAAEVKLPERMARWERRRGQRPTATGVMTGWG